jgi:hypothetical protein
MEHRGHRAHRVDEANHWLTFYEERAAIREYDCGLPRPEAEAGALQEAIAHWLVRNPLLPGIPGGWLHHIAEFGLTRDEGKHRETVIQELAPIADWGTPGRGHSDVRQQLSAAIS